MAPGAATATAHNTPPLPRRLKANVASRRATVVLGDPVKRGGACQVAEAKAGHQGGTGRREVLLLPPLHSRLNEQAAVGDLGLFEAARVRHGPTPTCRTGTSATLRHPTKMSGAALRQPGGATPTIQARRVRAPEKLREKVIKRVS